MEATPPAGWADLPEDLLVSVLNTLRHPRDLLACARVRKAWRNAESRAFHSSLHGVQDYGRLDRLITLTPIQLAALRDVCMSFFGYDPQSATAGVMSLAFISCSLPRLQRLELHWSEPFKPDEDWSQMIWQPRDFEIFCAMLPTSLRAPNHWGGVSLSDLGHLTALTELRFDRTVLTGLPLPLLPALRVLGASGHHLSQQDTFIDPGPRDLGLATATPLVTDVDFDLGNIVAPHEELATLASLAQLKTLALDFNDSINCPPANLLRPTTLLSLPPSITKLVLRQFNKCVPTVTLPEDIAIVFEDVPESEEEA